jgi:hypothetical protein
VTEEGGACRGRPANDSPWLRQSGGVGPVCRRATWSSTSDLDMTDEMLHPARRNAVEAQVANVYVREGPHRGDPAPPRPCREALSTS